MIAALLLVGALAPGHCGALHTYSEGGDYTDPKDRAGLAIVESFHFGKQVEQLVRGMSSSVGDDIGYTLEHFPNHHRALSAMVRLAVRDKTAQPRGAKYSVACYFDRAIRFRPRDATVRSIYGAYLLTLDRTDAALEQLEEAAQLAPDNPTTHYNLGLLYLKKNDFARAAPMT